MITEILTEIFKFKTCPGEHALDFIVCWFAGSPTRYMSTAAQIPQHLVTAPLEFYVNETQHTYKLVSRETPVVYLN